MPLHVSILACRRQALEQDMDPYKSEPTCLFELQQAALSQSTTLQTPAGRADYFGELANTAARVAALAAPGQILIESSQVDVTMPDGTTLLMEEFPTYLPVKWAASGQPRLSAPARRNASDGGALGFQAAGSPYPASPRRGPSGGGAGPAAAGRQRRASYSAGPSNMVAGMKDTPLALPFQRNTRHVTECTCMMPHTPDASTTSCKRSSDRCLCFAGYRQALAAPTLPAAAPTC